MSKNARIARTGPAQWRAESDDLAEELAGVVADHVEGALVELFTHAQQEGRRLGALSTSLRSDH